MAGIRPAPLVQQLNQRGAAGVAGAHVESKRHHRVIDLLRHRLHHTFIQCPLHAQHVGDKSLRRLPFRDGFSRHHTGRIADPVSPDARAALIRLQAASLVIGDQFQPLTRLMAQRASRHRSPLASASSSPRFTPDAVAS